MHLNFHALNKEMSDIILGEMARFNFGIRHKYDDDLIQDYKTYIDNLEKDIITAVYGTSLDNCVINKTYNLITDEEDTDVSKYSKLENPLIKFCQLHNIFIKILRNNSYIEITIDLLMPYRLTYE